MKQEANYLSLRKQEWDELIAFFEQRYSECTLCPRNCKVRRDKGEFGFCGAGSTLKVASINLHYGEEPPVSGENGSGTIFFSGCPLKCCFCQNYPISQMNNGIEYSAEQMADQLLLLQRRGAENINLVTPTPYYFLFLKALRLAAKRGLKLRVVLNTSGWEHADIIDKISTVTDVFLPDIKYVNNDLSVKYSEVDKYFDYAFNAVKKMVEKTGEFRVDEQGRAVKGTIIRHLILPGEINNSKDVIKVIASDPVLKKACISLMSQFFPAHKSWSKGLDRKLGSEEYEEVRKYFNEYNVSDGWFQELV